VAVQHAETPRGRDEHPRSRKQNLNESDGQLSLRSREARSNDGDEHGGGKDASQDEQRHEERQQREHGPRRSGRGIVLAARTQRSMHRDERAGERPFAKQILKKVGNAERGVEGVRRFTHLTEVRGEQTDAEQPGEPTYQNAGRD